MKLVLKIGGAALEDESLVLEFCATVAALANDGHHLLVVHGGGAALSRTLKALGVEPKFVNGLRVTDAKTLRCRPDGAGRIAEQEAGSGHQRCRPAAVGVCGSDLQICTAQKKVTAPGPWLCRRNRYGRPGVDRIASGRTARFR